MTDSERWKQWIGSRQGRSCADPDTLGINDPGKYLQNRLWEAFMAGAERASPIAVNESCPPSPDGKHRWSEPRPRDGRLECLWCAAAKDEQ